ncbi:hypothetical protein C2845_PM06G24370 [Panicum miliaceum]|uniref:Pentatricopeptide repeat-containing protein n=1 Tax=Panicum miliaceum TaxID=4540 RepID=A0A3L6RCR3_PANMI|nr:hypothetical protein C2845_PM06G24370 [Panicum miliaceum]
MTHHPGTPSSISSSPSYVSGALAASLLLAGSLLLSYAALRDVPSVRLVLRHHPLRLRSAFLWNSPSRALASAALPAEALRVYNRMARSGVASDDGTFPFALHAAAAAAAVAAGATGQSLLPALVDLGCFHLGKEVHGYRIWRAMESDIFIANSMMDMYAKFGSLEKASAIIEKIDAPNVVPWNAMIANLAQNGAESEAFRLFIEMQKNGKCPNAFTVVNLLPACSSMGKQIHAANFLKMGTSSISSSPAQAASDAPLRTREPGASRSGMT